MEFRDQALDEQGQPRDGAPLGAAYVSVPDGAWRLVAGDPHRPESSGWQVWQHVDPSAPRGLARSWVRRVPWVRLTMPEQAEVVATVLAALPANASWEVARVALREALRAVGAAVFFRSMATVNDLAARLAMRLRERRAAEDPLDDA